MDIERILKILTFAAVLIAGVIIVIISVMTKHYEYLALLPFCIVGGITGFLYGTKGRPSGSLDPLGTGGKFMGLPDWVSLVDLGLLVVGVAVIIIVRVVQ